MVNKDKKIKICRTATVAYYMTNHIKPVAEHLRNKGVEVVLICSYGPEIHQINLGPGLSYEEIEIARQIDPKKDIITLFKLIRAFKKHKFDIVHSTTPKGGLLSCIAAFLVGVPVRLHTWTGQPWVTLRGPKKLVTMFADILIGLLCTRCYADSPSQRDFLIQKKIIRSKNIKVIHKGSLSGVDIEKFQPQILNSSDKDILKKEIGLSKKSKIITFIGRINKDKGIIELISAFKKTLEKGYDIDLLLIGPLDQDSEGYGFVNLKEYIKDCSRIHYVGYQKQPEDYLAISDIFCLPSYREGFGTTVIEAAAMGIPSVGTKINGLVDAIVDGETGILVELKSVEGLVSAFRRLLDNPKDIENMGKKARLRCVENFDRKVINDLLTQEYLNILNAD